MDFNLDGFRAVSSFFGQNEVHETNILERKEAESYTTQKTLCSSTKALGVGAAVKSENLSEADRQLKVKLFQINHGKRTCSESLNEKSDYILKNQFEPEDADEDDEGRTSIFSIKESSASTGYKQVNIKNKSCVKKEDNPTVGNASSDASGSKVDIHSKKTTSHEKIVKKRKKSVKKRSRQKNIRKDNRTLSGKPRQLHPRSLDTAELSFTHNTRELPTITPNSRNSFCHSKGACNMAIDDWLE